MTAISTDFHNPSFHILQAAQDKMVTQSAYWKPSCTEWVEGEKL
jgi:hypothetical protein